MLLLLLLLFLSHTHEIQIGLHHLGISTSPRGTRNRFARVGLVNILCRFARHTQQEERETTTFNHVSGGNPNPTLGMSLIRLRVIYVILTDELEPGQFPCALLRDQNRRWTHILVDYVARVVEEGEGLDYLQDAVLEFNV